jgi:hypothetical protein
MNSSVVSQKSGSDRVAGLREGPCPPLPLTVIILLYKTAIDSYVLYKTYFLVLQINGLSAQFLNMKNLFSY